MNDRQTSFRYSFWDFYFRIVLSITVLILAIVQRELWRRVERLEAVFGADSETAQTSGGPGRPHAPAVVEKLTQTPESPAAASRSE